MKAAGSRVAGGGQGTALAGDRSEETKIRRWRRTHGCRWICSAGVGDGAEDGSWAYRRQSWVAILADGRWQLLSPSTEMEGGGGRRRWRLGKMMMEHDTSAPCSGGAL
ncbi:hypothetical protein ACLOJK_034687, partial [Asimina triloba]